VVEVLVIILAVLLVKTVVLAAAEVNTTEAQPLVVVELLGKVALEGKVIQTLEVVAAVQVL
jgi:hypothetical protein